MQVLTSCWSSGHAGPVAFCLPEGAITKEQLELFNRKHRGIAYCLTSGSNTHFMNAEVLCQVLEQLYSPALDLHKARLDAP